MMALATKATIPAFFEGQVLLHGSRPAVITECRQSTYAELNASANQFCHEILERGGRCSDRVVILMRHDVLQIAAVLAVLKAGRVVVVLNPTDPVARLQQVVRDAEPALVLADRDHQSLAAEVAVGRGEVVILDDSSCPTANLNPDLAIKPDDLAFLIYTSGTTGKPKGVMRTHRNILHQATRTRHCMRLEVSDRVALLASLSGGHGLSTLFGTLFSGAALGPFACMQRGVVGLADWLRRQAITVYSSSASLFRHFVKTLRPDEYFPDVRMIRLGSEAIHGRALLEHLHHFAGTCVFVHTLSSSETGTVAHHEFAATDLDHGRLHVGKVAADVELLLLDERRQPVPPGGVGEIVVRGSFLSPGYWHNEELTAQRFFGPNDPSAVRTYHSGDLGRWDAAGHLHVVGRKDARLKIRGYRIDPGEVQEAIEQVAGVERAVVDAVIRHDQEPQLVAFVVPRPGQQPTAAELRRHLRGVLPVYMIPASFVMVDRLPLTPHGKVDREKLRSLTPAASTAAPSNEVASKTERLLIDLWNEIFHRSDIGRCDDFFQLGGDSLLAAVVAAKVHAALEVTLDLTAFTECPTVAELAARIDELAQVDKVSLPPLVPVSRKRPLPLSFTQERAWKYSQTPKASAGYTRASAHRIVGPLNVDVLRAAIQFVVGRHDILRTTYEQLGGQPVQVVQPRTVVDIPFMDLSGDADAEARASEYLRLASQRPFNLGTLPLLRLFIVRLRPHVHRLLRVSHHILSDASSWSIFFHELGAVYEALLAGKDPPLPERADLQYADYAAWQRRVLGVDRDACRQSLAWWQQQLASPPPPLELPFRHRRERGHGTGEDGILHWGLPPDVTMRLAGLGRETGATYFMVRLAGFAAVLSAVCGQEDLILGKTFSSRNRVELQQMFGWFANLATLRLRVDRSVSFRAWLKNVRHYVASVQSNSQLPYELVREELTRRGVTPPEIRAIVQVSESTSFRFGGLEVESVPFGIQPRPWGFTIRFDPVRESEGCSAVFDPHLYESQGVRRFVEQMQRFFAAASARPDGTLGDLLKEPAVRRLAA